VLHQERERERFLATPIERFEPEAGLTVSQFLEKLEKTGGQPRQLAEAAGLWDEILKEKRTVFCAIAGAPVPFGFGPTIATLIEKKYIDVLAIPGSQIGHDVVETLGGKHFQGRVDSNDAKLIGNDINRYWNTFGDERDFKLSDEFYKGLMASLSGKILTTREFLYRLGEALVPCAKQDGILTTAFKHSFPIYCPGIADSVVGTDIAEVRHKYGSIINFDVVADNLEATAIVAATEDLGGRTSAIIFGGGWPRNWIQQAQACSYMIDRGKIAKGHAEAIRFSYDPAETGGLSGSTISEGISWRKYSADVKSVEAFLDAQLSMALLAQFLLEKNPQRTWKLNFFHSEEDGTLSVCHNKKLVNLQEYIKHR